MKEIKKDTMAKEEIEVNKEVKEAVEEVTENTSEYAALVPEWKAKWGKVFRSIVAGEEVIWRKLKRKEYVNIMATTAEMENAQLRIYERQELITKTVVLYPFNLENLIEDEAGFATTVSDEALLKSGFEMLALTEEI